MKALFERILNEPKLRSAAVSNVLFGVLTGMSLIASKRNNKEKSVAFASEAIVTLEAGAETELFMLANAYNNLGVMHSKNENLDEAKAKYQRASELFKTILPNSHPLAANLENNPGYLFFR